ncbi:MAG: AbiV family abortive infection protein [Halomonas sp.]|uniref:AbiV family abortive infection protein n=1 Tax=Halomonas sp. TaxID=1486246 RepID=UPI003F91652A
MKALSIQEIELAREKLLRNAKSLFAESQLLYQHGFFPRAYCLAHLCCEELAKIHMLVGVGLDLVNGDEVDWRKLHRRLTRHQDKIDAMHVHDYFQSEIRADDSDVREHEAALKKTPHLNDMKNNSLYAGVVNSVFKEPTEVVTQDDAKELINITTERLRYIQAVEQVSLGKIATSETGAKMRRFSKEYNKSRKADA